MGSKVAARAVAEKAKVPMVPGTKKKLKDAKEAKETANEDACSFLKNKSFGHHPLKIQSSRLLDTLPF